MLPLLFVVFRVSPLNAVGTDLAYAVPTKILGAIIHHRQRTMNVKLVLLLCIGGVPGAVIGILSLAFVKAHISIDELNAILKHVIGFLLIVIALVIVGVVFYEEPGDNLGTTATACTYHYQHRCPGWVFGQRHLDRRWIHHAHSARARAPTVASATVGRIGHRVRRHHRPHRSAWSRQSRKHRLADDLQSAGGFLTGCLCRQSFMRSLTDRVFAPRTRWGLSACRNAIALTPLL